MLDLASLYRQAPDDVKQAGSAWYWKARLEAQRIGRENGLPWHRVAAAIAVLSPLQPWEKNVEMAETLAQAIGAGEPEPPPQTFGRNWSKAIEVLHGEPIDDHVKGPKVRRFYLAICGDGTHAVVDSWMCQVLHYPKVPRPGRTYEHLAARIHDAAREVNVSVAELQATLWILVRDEGTRHEDGTVTVQGDLLAA